MTDSPQFAVDTGKVREHYDRLSRLYRLLWGEHLHHGYFENGERPRRAQIRLMERLAELAAIPSGSRVLDIGCGLGGSALWLARQFGCDVTGMTISPVQARLAAKKAASLGLSDRVRFEVKDANTWRPEAPGYDVVWIMESSEHFPDKPGFFERCGRALRPGGTLAVAAWLRRDGRMRDEERPLIAAIAGPMMSASLDTLSDYRQWMGEAGLEVIGSEDISRQVAPTWSHCAKIGANPVVRMFLPFTGEATRSFVRAFPLMVEGYRRGAMAFGIFAAKRPG